MIWESGEFTSVKFICTEEKFHNCLKTKELCNLFCCVFNSVLPSCSWNLNFENDLCKLLLSLLQWFADMAKNGIYYLLFSVFKSDTTIATLFVKELDSRGFQNPVIDLRWRFLQKYYFSKRFHLICLTGSEYFWTGSNSKHEILNKWSR